MRNRLVALAVWVVFLIDMVWTGANPVYAAGYIVDTAADDAEAHDVNPGDSVCADTYNSCTLRAAIEEANAQPGPHTITFSQAMNIYINVTVGAFPTINKQIRIDASAVWNAAGNTPGVVIDGGNGSFTGLMLNSAGCEIYGLYITAFNGSGVYITSGSNTIGGTGAGQRNIISGNNTAITLSGGGAQSNLIQNNYIGLTASGTAVDPNETGILVTGGASNNIIGGNTTAQNNYIGGNTSNGIVIESSGTNGNSITGNAIGLGADHATTVGNGQYGVRVQNGPANNSIGASGGAGNFIAYNGSSGVYIGNSSSNTQVSGNLIGANTLDGISIYDSTGSQINNNTITSNGIAGVRVSGVSAAGNLIWPNSISNNGSRGIIVQDGGNMGIAAPSIDSANTWGASGTACASCRVALYSDAGDEGQVYHDILDADAGGHWSYVGGPLVGPNLTATAIDISGNTSEFSGPLVVSPAFRVFMPFVSRK